MLLSDSIAKLIEEMLDSGGGRLEIGRNDLATRIGCVPSQINYVITSRFTPERGYIIESRRGGGGYIRIIKKEMHRDEYLMHVFQAVGGEIDERSACAFIRNILDNGFVTGGEAKIASAAVSATGDNKLRADILRQIILVIMM